MVSKLALGAIWAYQRFLSPHKGFRCAHSVRHGGTGCSGYAKHAIRDTGLWAALPEIRQRFRDCKTALDTLRANCSVQANWAEEQAADHNANLPRRDRKRAKSDRNTKSDSYLGSACDCGDFAFCGLALPAFLFGTRTDATATPDKLGTPVEGSADGCGSADCAAPSCDRCGGCDCAPSCG